MMVFRKSFQIDKDSEQTEMSIVAWRANNV